MARSAGARPDRRLASACLGTDRGGDQPQPARHRPVRAGKRQRRVRGRHAVLPARRDRPAGAARPARNDAQRHRLSRAADAPGGIGGSRRQRLLGRPLRAEALRGLRHPFRLAAARRGAGRPAAAALHARDREPRRLSRHRPCPRGRGRRGPQGGARRSVDRAMPGLRRRSAADRPARRAGRAC